MTDDDGLSWLPLLEAAMRLGKSTDAVRSMVRRDKLPTRKGNDGRLLIGVPAVVGQAADGLPTVIDRADDGRMTAVELRLTVEELRDELMETREKLTRSETELAAQGKIRAAEVAAAEVQVEATRDTATARVNLGKLEIAAVRELADRLTAELVAARAELAEARRPWLARVLAALRKGGTP